MIDGANKVDRLILFLLVEKRPEWLIIVLRVHLGPDLWIVGDVSFPIYILTCRQALLLKLILLPLQMLLSL